MFQLIDQYTTLLMKSVNRVLLLKFYNQNYYSIINSHFLLFDDRMNTINEKQLVKK